MQNRKEADLLWDKVDQLQSALLDLGDMLDKSSDKDVADLQSAVDSAWVEVENLEELAIQLDAEYYEGHLDRESSLEINDEAKDLADLV